MMRREDSVELSAASSSLVSSRRRRRSVGAPLAVWVVLLAFPLGCLASSTQEASGQRLWDASGGRRRLDTVTCGEFQCVDGGLCVASDDGAPPRCQCPDGVESCRAEPSECGKSTGLYCRNGSQCAKTTEEETGLKRHFCNCSVVEDDEEGLWDALAGNACQYRATSYCVGDAKDEVPQWTSFCTNWGTCKGRVGLFDEHPGCTCRAGFEGDFCELKVGEVVVPNKETKTLSSGPSVMEKVLFVFGAALLVVVVAVLAVKTLRRIRQENEERRLVENANFVTSELAFTGRDEEDDDDDGDDLGSDKNKRTKKRTNKAYKAVTETDDVVIEPLDENEII